jgi:hypothetical protein
MRFSLTASFAPALAVQICNIPSAGALGIRRTAKVTEVATYSRPTGAQPRRRHVGNYHLRNEAKKIEAHTSPEEIKDGGVMLLIFAEN